MSPTPGPIAVRTTQPADIPQIIELSKLVYPLGPPWTAAQLTSHLRVFPEGQLVAVEAGTDEVVGMAASLIILWDDYDVRQSWRDFTANGMFTNHDPERGRTLYGAEVMVRPSLQHRGIGTALYHARRDVVTRLKLLRVRAGARLRGYHRYADRMSAEDYVLAVLQGELTDPTLSFQLKMGFHVLAVVPDYLPNDPESLGHVAVIEWINERVAKPEDYLGRDPRFQRDTRTG
ncbi:MAG: GNAT family N-acetyltransferase [Nitrospirota bacterium]